MCRKYWHVCGVFVRLVCAVFDYNIQSKHVTRCSCSRAHSITTQYTQVHSSFTQPHTRILFAKMRLSDISARKCKLQCGNIVLFFELSFVALLIRFGLINLQSTIGRAHRKSNARARIRVRTFACVKRFFTQLRIFLDMRTKVHIPFSSAHVPTLSIIITIIILCFFTLFLVSARSYASRIQIIAMNSNTKRRENVTHTLLLRRIYIHMYIF